VTHLRFSAARHRGRIRLRRAISWVPPALACGALLALVALPLSGCADRGGVVEVSTEDAKSTGGAASDSDYERATNEPSKLAGLKLIAQGVPGVPLRVGGLSVVLEQVGPGPLSNIESGERLNPRPWTERLSVRLVVRNAEAEPAKIALRDNYPEVQDDRGHLRPVLRGVGRIDAEGLAQDDSGRKDYEHLSPGGSVTIQQSFEIRTDDHERPLFISLRVSPDALVRFTLW
jgi:hypothetical protein